MDRGTELLKEPGYITVDRREVRVGDEIVYRSGRSKLIVEIDPSCGHRGRGFRGAGEDLCKQCPGRIKAKGLDSYYCFCDMRHKDAWALMDYSGIRRRGPKRYCYYKDGEIVEKGMV